MSKTLDSPAFERFITAINDDMARIVTNEGQLIETLQTLTDYCQRLEGRVSALENIRLVVRAPRGSKLFLITACAASAYAGFMYAEKLREEHQEWRRAKKEEYLKSRIDHPAGTHLPKTDDTGNSTDNPEN
jgi:hypothetical protein